MLGMDESQNASAFIYPDIGENLIKSSLQTVNSTMDSLIFKFFLLGEDEEETPTGCLGWSFGRSR